jgi:CubicO group peptidase (beta-lactamase class C family)
VDDLLQDGCLRRRCPAGCRGLEAGVVDDFRQDGRVWRRASGYEDLGQGVGGWPAVGCLRLFEVGDMRKLFFPLICG